LLLKDVTISVSKAAREWLAERGFDPKMGARPMKRVIQEQIKRPLADDLLFGELAEGGQVEVLAPIDQESPEAADSLLLKVTKRSNEPKALPASAD
jgi:ATP-dependent Clp protease ATP-binding subunit ClpA